MPAMRFPCRLEPGLGRFGTLSEAEEIAQSVRMILTTRRGERPFRPKFGSRLSQYAFEKLDTTFSLSPPGSRLRPADLGAADLEHPGGAGPGAGGRSADGQRLL